MNLDKFKQEAQNRYQDNKAFLNKLRRKKPGDLDDMVHHFHQEIFENIDCLSCANCCKTTSPIIIDKDVERMAKHFKMKPAAFIQKYLQKDEDDDYIFQETPCPFLMPDNYCMIYEFRPRACREFPHTNRRRFHQILKLSQRNTLICPAVMKIVEALKKHYC